MKLIAKKPCSFGGKNFVIGEEIPSELVVNPKTQEKLGVLTITPDDNPILADCTEKIGQVHFSVPVHGGEEDFAVDVTNEELVLVTDVLQANAETAAEIISTIETEVPLILIDVLDGRKAVKKAVKERVDVLLPEVGKEPETAAQEVTEGGDA